MRVDSAAERYGSRLRPGGVQVTIVDTGLEHPAIPRYRLRKTDDPEWPLELTRVRDGDLIT